MSKSNEDLKSTLTFITSIIIACVAFFTWGGKLYKFIGHSDIVTQFDFYLSISLILLCVYLINRIKSLRKSISSEYKSYIDNKVDTIKGSLKQNDDKILGIMNDIRDVRDHIDQQTRDLTHNMLMLIKNINHD
jgi:hypothetical protein